MIDFSKILTYNQKVINRLYDFAQIYFKPQKPQNNNYLSFGNGSNRFRLEFRKVFQDGNLVGFRHVEICFSPHYYFNDDLHNGNDFSPVQCIKTLKEIMKFLQISKDEITDFKVVNLEYGLNLQLDQSVPQLVNGLLYSNRKPFLINQYETSKNTGNSKFKIIKAYDKGIQFKDLPQYQININTFRFEVKSKKSRFINDLGIYNLTDLLNLKKYNELFQSILNEWEKVLIINLEIQNDVNNFNYWSELINAKDRNEFTNSKKEYYKNIATKDNLHLLIKCKIIDKITYLSKYAYFPQEHPINTRKDIIQNSASILIKCESAYLEENNSVCLVTGLDISMQKKTSKYLCSTGLIYYLENEPETYRRLKDKYLTAEKRGLELRKQIYYLAHNIRNKKTNAEHNKRNNRQRFEQRNYPKHQLQFSFIP